jgi:hypothetical protein
MSLFRAFGTTEDNVTASQQPAETAGQVASHNPFDDMDQEEFEELRKPLNEKGIRHTMSGAAERERLRVRLSVEQAIRERDEYARSQALRMLPPPLPKTRSEKALPGREERFQAAFYNLSVKNVRAAENLAEGVRAGHITKGLAIHLLETGDLARLAKELVVGAKARSDEAALCRELAALKIAPEVRPASPDWESMDFSLPESYVALSERQQRLADKEAARRKKFAQERVDEFMSEQPGSLFSYIPQGRARQTDVRSKRDVGFDAKRFLDELSSPLLSRFRTIVLSSFLANAEYEELLTTFTLRSMEFPRERREYLRSFMSLTGKDRSKMVSLVRLRSVVPQGASQSLATTATNAAVSVDRNMERFGVASESFSELLCKFHALTAKLSSAATMLWDPSMFFVPFLVTARSEREAFLAACLVSNHNALSRYVSTEMVVALAVLVFFRPDASCSSPIIPQSLADSGLTPNLVSQLINSPLSFKISAFMASVTAAAFTDQLWLPFRMAVSNISEFSKAAASDLSVVESTIELVYFITDRILAVVESGDPRDLLGRPKDQVFLEEVIEVSEKLASIRVQPIKTELFTYLERGEILIARSMSENFKNRTVSDAVSALFLTIKAIKSTMNPERAAPAAFILTGEPGTGKTSFVAAVSRAMAIKERIPEGIRVQMDFTDTKHQVVPPCALVANVNDAFQTKEEMSERKMLPLMQSLVDTGDYRCETASIIEKQMSAMAPNIVFFTTNATRFCFSAATGHLNKLNRRFIIGDQKWTPKAVELCERAGADITRCHSLFPLERDTVEYSFGYANFPAEGNNVSFKIDKVIFKTLVLAEAINFVLDQEAKRVAPKDVAPVVTFDDKGRAIPQGAAPSSMGELADDDEFAVPPDESVYDGVRQIVLDRYQGWWRPRMPFEIGDEFTRIRCPDDHPHELRTVLGDPEFKHLIMGARVYLRDDGKWYTTPVGSHTDIGHTSFVVQNAGSGCVVIGYHPKSCFHWQLNQANGYILDAKLAAYNSLRMISSRQLPSVEEFATWGRSQLGKVVFGAVVASTIAAVMAAISAMRKTRPQATLASGVVGIPREVTPVPRSRSPAGIWMSQSMSDPRVEISHEGQQAFAIMVTDNLLHCAAHFFEGNPQHGLAALQDGQKFKLVRAGVSHAFVFDKRRLYVSPMWEDTDAAFYLVPHMAGASTHVYQSLRATDAPVWGPGDMDGHAVNFEGLFASGFKTQAGDCGRPYWHNGSLVGIHVGMNPSGTNTFFTRLSKKRVMAVKKHFDALDLSFPIHSYELNPVLQAQLEVLPQGMHPSSDASYLSAIPGLLQSADHLPIAYSRSTARVRMTGRPTKLRQFVRFDECPEHVPPHTGHARKIGERWVSAVTTRVESMPHHDDYCEKTIDRAVQAALDDLPPLLQDGKVFELHPLTLHQSLSGSLENRLINPRDNTKAVGPVMRANGLNKKSVFKLRPDGQHDVDPLFMEEFERLRACIAKGESPISTCTATLKDELFTKEKADAGKARFFYVQCVALNTLTRMYILPLLVYLLEHPTESGVVGLMNAGSVEWQMMYEHLARKNVGPDGDIKKAKALFLDQKAYDNHHAVMMLAYARFMRSLARRLGYAVEEADMVFTLLCSNAKYVLEMEGNYFLVGSGLTSGRPDTLVANCVISKLSIYYAFFRAGLSDPALLLGIAGTGDDNITTVAEGVPFTGIDLQRGQAELGYVVTASDKSPDIAPTGLFEGDYLKRRAVWRGNRLMAPLAMLSILKSLCYCVSVTPEVEDDRNFSALCSATRELWMHDRSVWDEYYPRFCEMAQTCGSAPLPTYEELHDEYEAGVFATWDVSPGLGA